jgi:hypothetical protein
VELFERGLILLAGAAFALNLFFLYLLARFYEIKSRERIYAWGFLLLIAPMLLAGVQYALFSQTETGDARGDLLLGAGGVGVLVLNHFVSSTMTRRRP